MVEGLLEHEQGAHLRHLRRIPRPDCGTVPLLAVHGRRRAVARTRRISRETVIDSGLEINTIRRERSRPSAQRRDRDRDERPHERRDEGLTAIASSRPLHPAADDVLEAREIAIVDDASDGGEGVDDGRASELYEMRGRASEGEGDGTKASETKASFVARRVEVCGFVVEKRRRKDSKVIFTVDDGSGCVECVVWTQDGDAVSGEQMELFGIASTADGAAAVARDIRVGSLARVQGRIRDWNGRRQINATAVQVDLDPNEELLFWLDASLEI